MNKIVFFLSIAGAFLVAGGLYKMIHNKSSDISSDIKDLHASWKVQYQKTYSSAAEESYRSSIFHQNYQKVMTHNASDATYTMALNNFADMTGSEFKAKLLGYKSKKTTKNYVYLPEASSDSVDWRTKGAVTAVKNQGMCGSCWAFSATGSMEGAYFLKNNKLVSLSEQQLVACSKPQGNEGCSGGLMDNAFKYVKDNGMESEGDYPYHGMLFWGCHYDKSKVVESFKMTGFTDVPKNDNDQLKAAVEKQPISIALDAESLQSYNGGIFNSKSCGTQLDHGVLAVGYGEENGVKFWIVKNSWGGSWGESGYFRILRDEGVKEAMCGMSEQASYPQMG